MHLHVFIRGLPCVHVCTRVLICVRVSVYICMGYIYVCMCIWGNFLWKFANTHDASDMCMYVWVCMRANHMEINIQTCIIVHVYLCPWRIVVMNLDVWICISKSLCSGMCKKKGVEGGGGASFVSLGPLLNKFSALPLEGDSKVQGWRPARKHASVY